MRKITFTIQRLIDILLVLIAFTIPLNIKYNGVLLLACTIIILITSIKRYKIDKFQIPYLIFFSITATSLLYTEPENAQIRNIEKLVSFILLPISFSLIKKQISKELLEKIIIAFILGSAVAATLAMVFSIEALKSAKFYIHHVYLGMYLNFAILFLAIKNYKTPSLRIKILTLISILILSFFLVQSGAKMQILILALFFFIVILTARKNNLLLLMTLIIIALSALFILKNENARSRISDLIYNGDKVRMLNWKASYKVFKNNIVIGVGIGDILDEMDRFRDVNWFTELRTYNAHNQYLETLASLGIVGFGVFIWILYVNLQQALKVNEKLYIAFLILFLLSILTESMLVTQKGIVFFTFFSSLQFYNSLNTSTNR